MRVAVYWSHTHARRRMASSKSVWKCPLLDDRVAVEPSSACLRASIIESTEDTGVVEALKQRQDSSINMTTHTKQTTSKHGTGNRDASRHPGGGRRLAPVQGMAVRISLYWEHIPPPCPHLTHNDPPSNRTHVHRTKQAQFVEIIYNGGI